MTDREAKNIHLASEKVSQYGKVKTSILQARATTVMSSLLAEGAGSFDDRGGRTGGEYAALIEAKELAGGLCASTTPSE
jgi:hypothetical protein